MDSDFVFIYSCFACEDHDFIFPVLWRAGWNVPYEWMDSDFQVAYPGLHGIQTDLVSVECVKLTNRKSKAFLQKSHTMVFLTFKMRSARSIKNDFCPSSGVTWTGLDTGDAFFRQVAAQISVATKIKLLVNSIFVTLPNCSALDLFVLRTG